MGTLLNRRRVMGGGSSLPYDAVIEYLESTGTQYIDTGVILNGDSVYDLTFSITTAQSNGLIGARETYKDNDFSSHILDTLKNRRNYGRQEDISRGTIELNTQNNYRAEGNVYKGNGNLAHTFTKQTFETPVSAYICAINNNGSPFNHSKMRVYKCSIEGANKSVDLIPVRVGQTGYMYDKISGQLFGNAGTGDFVLGADKTE